MFPPPATPSQRKFPRRSLSTILYRVANSLVLSHRMTCSGLVITAVAPPTESCCIASGHPPCAKNPQARVHDTRDPPEHPSTCPCYPLSEFSYITLPVTFPFSAQSRSRTATCKRRPCGSMWDGNAEGSLCQAFSRSPSPPYAHPRRLRPQGGRTCG